MEYFVKFTHKPELSRFFFREHGSTFAITIESCSKKYNNETLICDVSRDGFDFKESLIFWVCSQRVYGWPKLFF